MGTCLELPSSLRIKDWGLTSRLGNLSTAAKSDTEEDQCSHFDLYHFSQLEALSLCVTEPTSLSYLGYRIPADTRLKDTDGAAESAA